METRSGAIDTWCVMRVVERSWWGKRKDRFERSKKVCLRDGSLSKVASIRIIVGPVPAAGFSPAVRSRNGDLLSLDEIQTSPLLTAVSSSMSSTT